MVELIERDDVLDARLDVIGDAEADAEGSSFKSLPDLPRVAFVEEREADARAPRRNEEVAERVERRDQRPARPSHW